MHVNIFFWDTGQKKCLLRKYDETVNAEGSDDRGWWFPTISSALDSKVCMSYVINLSPVMFCFILTHFFSRIQSL